MSSGAHSPGRPWPALEQLTLHDLDGAPFELRSLRGRRAVVFCFASW